MAEQVFLVLIETGSNQSFIFSSNRMRENVGASELVRRVGMEWVPAALADVFSAAPPAARAGQTTAEFVKNLRMDAGSLASRGYEIVVATSGKAMVLFKDAAQAQDLIWRVTFRALKEAPGLTVHGAITTLDLVGDKKAAALASRKVHDALAALKTRLWPSQFRAPMAPLLEPCVSSGLPLEVFVRDREDQTKKVAVSAATAVKDKARDEAYIRMWGDLLKMVKNSYKKFDEDLDGAPWIAFVHADGNGFGRVFLELDKYLSKDASAKDYIIALRNFSTSLELCSTEAFQTALDVLPSPKNDNAPFPVVPLVIGGDDMTAACDGRYALDFAARYLREFEMAAGRSKLAEQENFIPQIAIDLDKRVRKDFGAAAGVAIVKPHFPFHRAYDIAEDLLKSAKTAKKMTDRTDISALDYQVVFDDSATDIETMRTSWVASKNRLHGRPYVVSAKQRIERISENLRPWAECRRFWGSSDQISLANNVQALSFKREDDSADSAKALPRSQQKAMRDALFLGKEIAEIRWKVVRDKYQAKVGQKGFHWLGDLFYDDGEFRSTQFLDALEALDVAEGVALAVEPEASV